jgi:hypothetical protein
VWRSAGRAVPITGENKEHKNMHFKRIFWPTLAAGGPGEPSWHTDCLRAGRSGDRIPVGARFSTPALRPTQARTHWIPGHSQE